MPNRIDNARHWRAQAEAARTIANQLTNLESKRIMLGIALCYVQLAQQAEARRRIDPSARTERRRHRHPSPDSGTPRAS
jgi:hypothetical protein